MKMATKRIGVVVASALILTSIAVSSFAAKTPDIPTGSIVAENATVQVGETTKITVSLGEEYANKNFALETDAGMDSHTYKADKNGLVEFIVEPGGSSRYALTLLDEKDASNQIVKGQITEKATTVTTTETTEKSDTDIQKTNTKNIIIFGVGILLAVAYLVVSKLRPKKTAVKSQLTKINDYDNSNDGDDEEM